MDTLVGLDRAVFILFHHELRAAILDVTMPWLTDLGTWEAAAVAVPLAAWFRARPPGGGAADRRRWVQGLAIGLAAVFVASTITALLKGLVGRPRPPADPLLVEYMHIIGPGWMKRSWPSGHTTAAFAWATAVWNLAGPRAGLAAVAVACVGGWSRVYLGVHYPLDVVAGVVVGTVTVAWLFRVARRNGALDENVPRAADAAGGEGAT